MSVYNAQLLCCMFFGSNCSNKVKWLFSTSQFYVTSSGPPGKDGNARFTTIPLISLLSDQQWIRYPCFSFLSLTIKYLMGFSYNLILSNIEFNLLNFDFRFDVCIIMLQEDDLPPWRLYK